MKHIRYLIKKVKLLNRINRLLKAREAILEEAASDEFENEQCILLLNVDTEIKKHIKILDKMYEDVI